jgi:hypothetical protein
LNGDQIKVLERKGEVSGAIKEFEETLKQIEAVEKDVCYNFLFLGFKYFI